MDEITRWIPKQEAELFKEYVEELNEESKQIPWYYKAYLQFKTEKGDFDDMEPIIRHRILTLAYGK